MLLLAGLFTPAIAGRSFLPFLQLLAQGFEFALQPLHLAAQFLLVAPRRAIRIRAAGAIGARAAAIRLLRTGCGPAVRTRSTVVIPLGSGRGITATIPFTTVRGLRTVERAITVSAGTRKGLGAGKDSGATTSGLVRTTAVMLLRTGSRADRTRRSATKESGAPRKRRALRRTGGAELLGTFTTAIHVRPAAIATAMVMTMVLCHALADGMLQTLRHVTQTGGAEVLQSLTDVRHLVASVIRTALLILRARAAVVTMMAITMMSVPVTVAAVCIGTGGGRSTLRAVSAGPGLLGLC